MEEAIKMDALNELRNLMGDSLDDVLQTYIDYIPGQIDELSKAVANEEMELIGRSGSTQGTPELLEKLKGMYSDAEVLLREQLKK